MTTIFDIQEKTSPILLRYGIQKASIFGSIARGEAKEASDVDILVQPKDSMSLLEFAGLKLDLEEALQKKVDLVEYSLIRDELRSYIMKDAQIFYQV